MIPILFFSPVDFDRLYFKKIIFPLAQSKRFKIYVISRPADLLVDTLRGYKRIAKKLSTTVPKSDNVEVIIPFVLFNEVIHESLCSWGNINMKMLIWQVKWLIRKKSIDVDKLILWCYHPFHWKIMKEIPAKRKIYGVEDEYCYSFSKEDRLSSRVQNAEKKMILFSDEIVCASEKLREKFQKIVSREKKIHLVSVPADERSFQECVINNYVSWDVIPAPKAIIFGSIRRQTDLDLIEKLAIKTPELSIVFIGKEETGKYRNKKFKGLLSDYQNIYHLGYLSRDAIIYCMRTAVLGLYPAKKWNYSVYANPIRIYEYAANGIPVVASNINRESDYPELIDVVNNETEFILAVQNKLNKKISETEKEELIRFARKHSANEIVKAYTRIFQGVISV